PTDALVLTVHDGTAISEYVPFYGYYADDTQQNQMIYPASELTALVGKSITEMKFYIESVSGTGDIGDWIVSLGETEATTLSGLDVTTPLTQVYSGAMNFNSEETEMTVTFTDVYNYNGGNLLVEFNHPVIGSYKHYYFYGENVTGASYCYGSQRNFLPKTSFAFEEPAACIKPTGLAVNYAGGTEATVTWNGDAESYNIDVNGTVTEGVTSPYPLTGLELATTYEVKVQADCGGSGTSDWTSAVSFTTDVCLPADMCAITIVLTDSYGDGWNGNYMSVVDHATSKELGTYTIASGSTETFTLSVCNGRTIDFVFTGTNYPTENGWVITDVNGDVITEREGCNSGCDPEQGIQATYKVDCTVTTCKKPTDLAATEISGHSAKLSWTENGEAEAWVVSYTTDGENFTHVNASTNPYTLAGLNPETMYGVIVTPVCEVDKPSEMIVFTTDEACPAPSALTANTTPFTAEISWLGFGEDYDLQYSPYTPGTPDWLQYDNGTLQSNVGSSSQSTWTWGVMYPASMVNGNYLTKVAYYEVASSNYTDGTITISVYNGGDDAPETLLASETIAVANTNGMREVEIGLVEINPEENLWIIFTANATYCMAMSNQDGGVNSRWFYDGSDWVDFGTLFTTGAAYSFMIRAGVEDLTPFSWTTKEGVDTPCTITGLEQESTYAYRVKSNCGIDGESTWSIIKTFTTQSACDAPFDLVAEPLDETATLSWTGYQESYNLKYRIAAKYEAIFEDDFESGNLDQWTILHGEEATCPSGGYWYTIDPTSGLDFEAHSGDYCASSWSWNSSAYTADNYLVTPMITFGDELKFWVRTNTVYPDSYEVLLSTTGNTIADFTTVLQAMAPAPTVAAWTEVTIDLTAYSGQGYIAIHHESYDANYLLIDDFGVYNVIPAGDWATVTNKPNPYVLTTDPSTTYEYQVQGVNGKCTGGLTDWSEIATFTTYSVVYDDEIWEPGETGYTDDVLVMHDVIIESDAIVYANSVTLDGTAQLIIEDGGQLYHNEPVEATYLKEIEAWTSKGGDGWYLIASPVNDAKISDLFEGTFDLFKYDEPTAYWYAYFDSHPFNKLSLGTGYLHASAAYKMVEITGEMIGTQDPDMAIALSYAGTDADLKGFNLIGNPFTRNITPDNMVIYDGTLDKETPVSTYYGMNDTRTDFMPLILSATNPIKPGEGFFIQASGDDQYVVFNPSTSSKDVYNGYISIVAGNESYSDMAYVQLGYGNTLRKMSMSDNTSVCVINNGDDYASARVEELEGMMPVNFKAASTGLYTISIKANDIETGMMHLIDNFTGVDIDLMAYPSYTFQATEFDSEERFTLVFDFNTYTGVNENYAEGNFVYQSGDELYISGDGTLEVFDVMGRFVASYEVNGSKRISTSQFNTGVYVFRMVGETMMTQKIVVR
ncbi:MAG: choice-of-anchor J domain-containing protein, partial [Bacteroidales bacterium]|nr:choice-of-anchor J domain-containing protein [Bacteroidales bacterium]